MEHKKILMVLMGLDIGGAETHVVGLSYALKKMGWEVLVASAGGVYEKKLTEQGIRHFYVPTATRSLKDMHDSIGMLRRIIQEEKPDIVHAHARIPAMLCGLLQRKLRFRFVTTCHWTFEVNPVFKLLSCWGQRTIAVSEDIRAYLINNYQISAGQIHVTVNGIDMEEYAPEVSPERIQKELQLRQDAPTVVCVTRFHSSRALSAMQLVQAAPALAERLPRAQVILVGDGECMEQIRQSAELVNKQLGYTCVFITGARTDVPELINAGDVFVGVSRAALEAMSCAKPVILCGNEGYAGLVKADQAARYRATNYCCRDYPGSTVEQLTRDLVSVFGMTEEERQQLGADGREIIRKEFSLEAMAKVCVEAYNALLYPRKKAVVSGYYGYRNRGDDAILRTMVRRYGSACDLTVLSKQPKETELAYGVSAVNRFSAPAVRRAIRNSDVLISGGGSLLQDRTSTRSLLYYLWVIRSALRRGCKVMVYANGIGPISKKMNRRLTAGVLEKVDLITVRDQKSGEEMQKLGVQHSYVLTADPVFSMTKQDRTAGEAYLRRAGISDQKKLIGIAPRHDEGTAAQIAELIDAVAAETSCFPVFISMQYPQDYEAARKIQTRMKQESVILPEGNSLEELLSVLSLMDMVVSMRLHAIIMAAVAETPAVCLDYDPKIAALANTLDLPLVSAGKGAASDAVLKEVLGVYRCREEYRQKLRERVVQQREAALQNDCILQELLKSK